MLRTLLRIVPIACGIAFTVLIAEPAQAQDPYISNDAYMFCSYVLGNDYYSLIRITPPSVYSQHRLWWQARMHFWLADGTYAGALVTNWFMWTAPPTYGGWGSTGGWGDIINGTGLASTWAFKGGTIQLEEFLYDQNLNTFVMLAYWSSPLRC